MRPLHEVHDDLAGGGGLHIRFADRRAGVHDDDRQAFARELQHFLLGQIFGTFVMAGHLLQRHRRLFRSQPPARRQADRADGAAVDGPLDADLARCLQQGAGAGDVDVVENGRVFRPESVMGRHVVELPAAA
jgi:hypothetical protein